jgi:hypothetical protein
MEVFHIGFSVNSLERLAGCTVYSINELRLTRAHTWTE